MAAEPRTAAAGRQIGLKACGAGRELILISLHGFAVGCKPRGSRPNAAQAVMNYFCS